MATELRPSTGLTTADLAALFTAAYEGYFVPFKLDEAAFEYMVDVFDLDLGRSVVAVDGDAPVGLANLGLRGDRTWLGGVGVVPARRREGLGEALTRALLDRGREAGADTMLLEVIVENEPAIALYEKLGFVRTRELEVLSLAADAGGGAAEEIPVETARVLVQARREGPEPWQRDDRTLENLMRRESPPAALVSGDAVAIYRQTGATVGLVQAAGGEGGMRALVGALRARGAVSAVNYETGDPVAAALREAGAAVTLRQYEMVCPL